MRPTRYEPWSLLNQLTNEINRLYDDTGPTGAGVAASDWVPAVDIFEEADRFVLFADLPGVKPEDIEMNMENGVLSIRGHRGGEKRDGGGFKRLERAQGTFFRRFSLPDTADAEKIGASCRNGVLEVTIPKQQKVKPRRIKVEG